MCMGKNVQFCQKISLLGILTSGNIYVLLLLTGLISFFSIFKTFLLNYLCSLRVVLALAVINGYIFQMPKSIL